MRGVSKARTAVVTTTVGVGVALAALTAVPATAAPAGATSSSPASTVPAPEVQLVSQHGLVFQIDGLVRPGDRVLAYAGAYPVGEGIAKPNGEFAIVLHKSYANAKLELVTRSGSATSVRVPITMPGLDQPPAPWNTTSERTEQGTWAVSGNTVLGGLDVRALDKNDRVVASTKSRADGSFTLDAPGKSGDALFVFAIVETVGTEQAKVVLGADG
ncbi:hypothetical protein EDF64_106192 [Curtobacterium flaccumfaciens]|uniref:Uncharacterized protein n=1 Tax=Curtobacterium flaccumfaciens TaxID=2035 RepID=A0A4R6DIT2_9MICO|nr:hypothetical protein [Curtobacterium flaccumfaciens]TDN44018.1 hypothetical protein EDF64_106192 [Curtobacterium flaccumfaciens]